MAGITIQEELVVKGIVSQEQLQIPFRIGVDGVTFTPSVSAEGVISWTNDGNRVNPTPINIKGQQGDNVEFRTSGGYVQWKPTSGTTWTNLISIAELAQLETTTGQSTTKGMTQKAITDALALKADKSYVDNQDATKVSKTGNETISGVKTFQSSPIVPTPISGTDVANKDYADTKVSKTGNETINGVKTFQSPPIVPTPTQTTEAATKGYVDNGLALKVSRADIDYLRYSDRVALDTGTIRDKVMLKAMYDNALNLLPNTLLAYSPEMGVKQSVSGLVYKASKLYDMSPLSNDASQATAGSQPYIGGNVAPNERLWLWGRNKSIIFSNIVFGATAKWSASFIIDFYTVPSGQAVVCGPGGLKIGFDKNNFIFGDVNSVLTYKAINPYSFSKISRCYVVARGNNTIALYINGLLILTMDVPTTEVTFSQLFWAFDTPKLYSLRIFNKDLSKSEIEGLDKFLASIYPEHETTNIGSQAWLTSNHIGNVTSDGFNIPEVQGNDAASNPELITNAADREFSSDTGFWTKTAQVTIGGGICNIKSTDGSTQGVSRSWLLTVGKVHKVTYDIIANRGGALRIDSGSTSVTIDSTVGSGKVAYFIAGTTTIDIRRVGVTDIDIDNVSIKEAGWSDSQAIYDYYISVGKSVLEATKAAAMWCKYNNSDDNAAVYGYILNGYAHNYIKNTAPKGLRLGLNNDWTQLFTTSGGNSIAGKKLKKEGILYWDTTNSGTNESGFTAIGGGRRNADGTYANIGIEATYRTAEGNVISILNNSDAATSTAADLRIGTSLRFLKNAPVGNETQELDTGVFTTDIATSQRELTMSFGHKVTNIKVNSLTYNLTNFKVELRTSAGVLIQTLVQGKSVTANVPIDFAVLIDQQMLFQDAKLWITATGNTGAGNLGMQVKIITKQNMF